MVSVNCSSEEGEASEYPSSSQRSTLENIPAARYTAADPNQQLSSTVQLSKMSVDDGESDSENDNTVRSTNTVTEGN